MKLSLQRYGDWALLALRLAIGVIFLYHGLMKWQMEDPSMLFTILKIVEPLGGAALILGVLSQWAALGLGIIMLGAIYMKMSGFGNAALDPAGTFAPQGGTGWEFDMMILAGCIVLLVMGAGKMAIDSMMCKK